jgi:tRNA pseudouridine38-40 synthase
MARYQLFITYDGTDFQGSQRQGKKRTVQLVLEDALRIIGWNERSIQLAGRTDSGVHASCQVAGCNLEWKHSTTALEKALNARLPRDLAVTKVNEVEEKFHARYDATSRTYRYRILASPIPNPLAERYTWRVWTKPEIEPLRQAAALFLGVHDFKAFGMPPKKGGSTIRQVFTSQWSETTDGMDYVVCANGFLYHMVRRLVQVQILVATEKLTLSDVEGALQNGKVIRTGMAPARGLVLEKVSYDEIRFPWINGELITDVE